MGGGRCWGGRIKGGEAGPGAPAAPAPLCVPPSLCPSLLRARRPRPRRRQLPPRPGAQLPERAAAGPARRRPGGGGAGGAAPPGAPRAGPMWQEAMRRRRYLRDRAEAAAAAAAAGGGGEGLRRSRDWLYESYYCMSQQHPLIVFLLLIVMGACLALLAVFFALRLVSGCPEGDPTLLLQAALSLSFAPAARALALGGRGGREKFTRKALSVWHELARCSLRGCAAGTPGFPLLCAPLGKLQDAPRLPTSARPLARKGIRDPLGLES